MKLENRFTVPVPVEQAWQVLLDVERIAPCMPGATLTKVDGDAFEGTVKVKVGPINLTYGGKAHFVSKDEQAHVAVIDGSGKETRGTGTAKALITCRLVDRGDSTEVEVAGEPLVVRGIRLLAEGGCAPVVVVVGARAAEVRPLCGGAQVVDAADWDTGMAASLRAGLGHLETTGAAAAVVALVDQPLVTPAAVQRLRQEHARGAVAAVAHYDGRPRNPVLLDRSTWAGVAQAATGDDGARVWLRAHPESVTAVDCTDVGAPDDVDTPSDLAGLQRRTAAPDPQREAPP